MLARLRILAGDTPETEYLLDRPKMVIGRHPQCEVVIPSASVSRNHAQLINRDGKYYVEDLRSRNGTYVNGARILELTQLQDGDELRICDFKARFQEDSPEYQTIGSGLTSRVSAIFVDDASRTQSSIRKRLEVSSDSLSHHLSASPDVKLQALLQLSKSLAKALSLTEVLQPVLESLFKIFPQADSGFIVFSQEDGSIQPVATRFRTPEEDSVRISRGIVKHVLSQREAIISADAADDSRFSMTDSIANFRIRSFMCAPLITPDGEILGAVQIDTGDTYRNFSDPDLELMLAVASQAAVTIKNAQLYEQALERRAYQRDLELAREVQRGLLPQRRPVHDEYGFFDYYAPAQMIGGDYYDYVSLSKDRLAVIVADVSGHGVPAALLMTKLAADARFCLATISEPSAVLERLNQLLLEDGVEDRFVTLALLVIDFRDGRVTVANAGHLSPFLRHVDGRVTLLADEAKGPPLGVAEGIAYRQVVVPFGKGETFVLVTDGITEAMDPADEMFGLERLQAALAQPFQRLDEFGKTIVSEVRRFTKTRAQSDDICLVCAHCLGSPLPAKETL